MSVLPRRIGFRIIALAIGLGFVFVAADLDAQESAPGVEIKKIDPKKPPRKEMAPIPGASPEVHFPTRFDDVEIVAEPALAMGLNDGDTRQGYIEYRFTITNNSATSSHEITIAVPQNSSYGNGRRFINSIKRTVTVDPQYTATISLFQPDVTLGGYQNARVWIDGRERSQYVNCRLFHNRDQSMHGMPRAPVSSPILVLCSEGMFNPLGNAVHFWAQERHRQAEANAKEKGEPIPETTRFEDRLATTDPFDTVRGGCYAKIHTHKLEAGKQYLVLLNQLPPGSGSFDPYLRVESSTRAQVAADDDSGGNRNSRLVFTPSVTDDYRFIATSFGGGSVFPYEVIIQYIPPGSMIPPVAGMPAGGVNQPFSLRRASRPVPEWSTSWLAYTLFSGVALEGAELDAAPAGVQAALFQYVECGGGLLISGPVKSLPTSWERFKTGRTIEVPGAPKSDPKYETTVYSPGFGQCVVAAGVVGAKELSGLPIAKAWENSFRAFDQVVSATDANRIFPVIETSGIPVRSLFAFMLAFVLIIGPLNFYLLSRAKRRIWLLWTVPAIALATSGLMFGYMVVSEGWHGHARVLGVTLLDQSSQRAVTIGWLGIYSPTTPGGGLVFSQNTELSPHFVNNSPHFYGRGDAQPMSMNWTHAQHLDGGWVSAKVPVHFATRRNERVQTRLSIRGPANAPVAVNTLGVDLEKLTYADKDGVLWTASNIPAGQEAPLAAAGKNAEGTLTSLNEGFASSWIRLADSIAAEPHRYLRPSTYLAVAAEPAFLEIGLDRTQSLNARSLIVGILKNE